MSYIPSIKAKMLTLVDELGLPQFFKEDVNLDLSQISRYEGSTLIWLLRTSGTALVPTKMGVDPVYITHWLWGNSTQEIVPFSIDTKTGVIEKITFEQAEKLVMAPPCTLSSLTSMDEHIEKVNKVLQEGVRLRLWGLFHSPSSVESIGGWAQWQHYFMNANNRVMANFMGCAIKYLQIHKDKAAA